MPSSAHSTAHLVDAAHALRSARCATQRRVFALRRDPHDQLIGVVDAGARRLYAALPLGLLVETLYEARSTLTEIKVTEDRLREMSAGLVDESLDRLCWLFGERLAREAGLAPWLDRRARYRLLCWPDFGEIGSDGDGARLCTLLAQRPFALAEMAASLKLPVPVVHGLINSLALCGALATDSARAPQSGGVATRRTIGNAEHHSLFERLLDRLTVR